jgi:hypothetical protein
MAILAPLLYASVSYRRRAGYWLLVIVYCLMFNVYCLLFIVSQSYERNAKELWIVDYEL